MALSLVGKNKLGFFDGRYPKNHFDDHCMINGRESMLWFYHGL